MLVQHAIVLALYRIWTAYNIYFLSIYLKAIFFFFFDIWFPLQFSKWGTRDSGDKLGIVSTLKSSLTGSWSLYPATWSSHWGLSLCLIPITLHLFGMNFLNHSTNQLRSLLRFSPCYIKSYSPFTSLKTFASSTNIFRKDSIPSGTDHEE